MNRIVEELKALFRQHRIPVFGTAESKFLESEPEGYRPSDMLSSASSIISFGIPIPKGLFLDEKSANKTYWRMANIYYQNIDVISSQAALLIENSGETAIPVPSCFPVELRGPGDFLGNISLVRMAEAAGIGKLGKNGLIFHSVYGPRLMLGGIVTTASLPTLSWPGKDGTGCPADCSVCQDSCPAHAIDGKGKVDRPACTKQSMHSPLLSLMVKAKTFSAEDMSTVFNTANVDGNAMYKCIKCVSDCPNL